MLFSTLRAGGCLFMAFLLSCLIASETLAAQPVESGANGISVTDFRGKSIRLQKPAVRIVCLIESALSGLYMLGVGQSVVGVSTSAYLEGTVEYYRKLDHRFLNGTLPTPGNWDFINIEKAMGLRPDLVVIWAHQAEAIAALDERGIPVFGVFIKSFEDVFVEIRALGLLTGSTERASTLIEYSRNELRMLDSRISGIAKPASVYFMWAQGELETSGRTSTVHELITLAGGRNAAESIDREHVVVNIERVIKWNPEVILMWPDPRRRSKDIAANPRWKTIRAVIDSRIYQLPDIFSCDMWTLKFLYAVKLTAAFIHPDLMRNVDPTAERARIFNELYRTPL